ncbi:MAG: IS200/IS605 family transposase [Rhodothermales bacterium]
MAHAYSCLYYHVVFATKYREPRISARFERHVWALIAEAARSNGLTPIKIGGVDDHVHVLVRAPARMPPSEVARFVKGGSSITIKRVIPELSDFAWQKGYSIFSVGRPGLTRLVRYIANQRAHHGKRRFEQEYLAILEANAIRPDDPGAVFD